MSISTNRVNNSSLQEATYLQRNSAPLSQKTGLSSKSAMSLILDVNNVFVKKTGVEPGARNWHENPNHVIVIMIFLHLSDTKGRLQLSICEGVIIGLGSASGGLLANPETPGDSNATKAV